MVFPGISAFPDFPISPDMCHSKGVLYLFLRFDEKWHKSIYQNTQTRTFQFDLVTSDDLDLTRGH